MVVLWDVGVGHRLQPLGLAGIGGDRGWGVPCPRVGLAGGGGRLWGMDDGALGDGDVDEGLDGVVLCCRLLGDGSRGGQAPMILAAVPSQNSKSCILRTAISNCTQ